MNDRDIKYPPSYIALFFTLLVCTTSVINVEKSFNTALFNFFILAVVYGFSLFCGYRYNLNKNRAYKYFTNIFAAISLFIFFLNWITMPLVNAVIWLMILIQTSRNFSLSSRREFYFSYLIALMLLLYASFIDKSTGFIIYILCFVVAFVYSLRVDHMDETMSEATVYVTKRDSFHNLFTARLLAWMFVCIMAAGFLIFLIVPKLPAPKAQNLSVLGWDFYNNKKWETEARKKRLETQKRRDGQNNLFEGEDDDTQDTGDDEVSRSDEIAKNTYEGFSNVFNITNIIRNTFANPILLYLRSDRNLYSRGSTFDTFDGTVWTRDKSFDKKIFSVIGRYLFKAGRGDINVSQTYYIKENLPNIIFSYYRPSKLFFPSKVIEKGDDFVFRSSNFLRKGTIYSTLSTFSYDDENRYFVTTSPDSNRERYLQLPYDIPDKFIDIPHGLTKDLTDDYEKAVTIEQHLKTNYEYTLHTVFEKNKDVYAFILETKEGHCEYFATAMVLFLRTLNIQARFVTGFSPGKYNPFTGYFEVRRLNGHAWVEAYIDNRWYVFEPTPSFNIPEISNTPFALGDMEGYLDSVIKNMFSKNLNGPLDPLLKILLIVIKNIFSVLNIIVLGVFKTGTFFLNWFFYIGWIIIGATLVSAALIYILKEKIRPVFIQLKLKKLMKKDNKALILHCYIEVERLFLRKRIKRSYAMTPREYQKALENRYGIFTDEIETIISLFNKVQYGGYSVCDSHAEKAFLSYTRIVKWF